MAIPSKYVSLVSRLISLTEQGKLDWNMEAPSRFSTMIKGFGATIGKEETVYGDQVELMVFNQEGIAVETFQVTQGEGDDLTMGELWNMARRQALKVDETMEGFERSLEELGGSS